jgi:hypothetical protein
MPFELAWGSKTRAEKAVAVAYGGAGAAAGGYGAYKGYEAVTPLPPLHPDESGQEGEVQMPWGVARRISPAEAKRIQEKIKRKQQGK